MAPLLLFVLLTFLTGIDLSNFYSLNLYFITVLLSMNTPIVPLFKSTFTATLLQVSIFSTPIFNYTFLSILKVFLISLWLLLSFTMPSRALACALLCYTFPSLRCTTFLSSFLKYLHYFSSSSFLLEMTPCSLFSFI